MGRRDPAPDSSVVVPYSVFPLQRTIIAPAVSGALCSAVGPASRGSSVEIEREIPYFTCRAAPAPLRPSLPASLRAFDAALYILRSAPLPDSEEALEVLFASTPSPTGSLPVEEERPASGDEDIPVSPGETSDGDLDYEPPSFK